MMLRIYLHLKYGNLSKIIINLKIFHGHKPYHILAPGSVDVIVNASDTELSEIYNKKFELDSPEWWDVVKELHARSMAVTETVREKQEINGVKMVEKSQAKRKPVSRYHAHDKVRVAVKVNLLYFKINKIRTILEKS